MALVRCSDFHERTNEAKRRRLRWLLPVVIAVLANAAALRAEDKTPRQADSESTPSSLAPEAVRILPGSGAKTEAGLQPDAIVKRAEPPVLRVSPLPGVWVQNHNGRPIAEKEIYFDNGILRIRYLWLAPGYTKGAYSPVSIESDGSLRFTEDYGTHIGRHHLVLRDPSTLVGKQEGSFGSTYTYYMTKK